jgi:uncharacterized membrane protein
MEPNDDHHWVGIFYRDRADPRLMVPKRYGWGWTLNYGRPMAWVWTFVAPAVLGMIIRRGAR